MLGPWGGGGGGFLKGRGDGLLCVQTGGAPRVPQTGRTANQSHPNSPWDLPRGLGRTPTLHLRSAR